MWCFGSSMASDRILHDNIPYLSTDSGRQLHVRHKKPIPQTFKWCTCHMYLSSIGKSVNKCFRDCEVYNSSTDTHYSRHSLAEYITRHNNTKNFINTNNNSYGRVS